MFLAIKNPFEARPTNGWCFSIQATAKEYDNYRSEATPDFSASETSGKNPELVDQFEKRMSQKFASRWFNTTTLYWRHDAEIC